MKLVGGIFWRGLTQPLGFWFWCALIWCGVVAWRRGRAETLGVVINRDVELVFVSGLRNSYPEWSENKIGLIHSYRTLFGCSSALNKDQH